MDGWSRTTGRSAELSAFDDAPVRRLSVRNADKGGSGQSRAAVFMWTGQGGCKTRASIGKQLSYIGDKTVLTYSTVMKSRIRGERQEGPAMG